MNARTRLIGVSLGSLSLLMAAGCVVAGTTGIRGCSASTKVWAQATEELGIDTTNLAELQVRTHNGAITHTGRSEADPTATVLVTKKGGGLNQADAEDALAAIQIVSESTGGIHRLGWKWSPAKRPGWGAQVTFEIQAPGALRFDGETHNGRVEVNGVTGNVKAVTHNGRVSTDSSGGKLYAKTHNGRIAAVYEGEHVTLLTHNGRVTADLTRCRSVAGSIETHNGGIELVLGEAASTKLRCETNNGRIAAEVALSNQRTTRRSLTGIVGEGGGDLQVSTHNGSIRIKKAAG